MELFATFTSLEGGANSGFDPAVISDKQYYMGTNVVSRRGRPHTRPDFRQLNLTFDNDDDGAKELLFRTGKFQGAKEYSPGRACYVVAMIGGYLFVTDLSTNKVYMPSGINRMNQHVHRCFFCQVVNYMIIQDGINRPIILNNLGARHSDADQYEVPAGTCMAFGHGRLFLKIARKNFIAGDIYKSRKPESVLKFTENTYLSEGGSFSVAPDLGSITAMAFATHFDTSTGDGPLLVCCENGVQSYSVQNSRLIWNDTDISKVQMRGSGVVGQTAIADINQDMMFWSFNGLRSWTALQQEAVYRRKYTNQSAEISGIVNDETSFILPYMSMIQFDNRLLMTLVGEKAKCKCEVPDSDEPEWMYRDYSFKCIGSLDFDQINNQLISESQRTVQSASYDGIWTGIHPTQLFAINLDGDQKAFAFDKSSEGYNRIWEITKEYTGMDSGVPIEAKIYTRAYATVNDQYVAQPFTMKRLSTVQLWMAGIRSRLPVELHIRNERAANYTLLQTREFDVQTARYDLDEENMIVCGHPINVGMVPFEDFSKINQPLSETLVYSGHEFSFKFVWRGYAELSRMLSVFSDEGKEQFVATDDQILLYDPPENKYNYRI